MTSHSTTDYRAKMAAARTNPTKSRNKKPNSPNVASEYTSEIGSYSCTSHLERLRKEGLRESYPDRLIVMRHSERVDDMFPGWIEKTKSNYAPYDGNMPIHLPVDRPVTGYVEDTPITVCGQMIASMVGRSLGSQNLVPDVIYCSPAIRCIQTARAVKEASGSKALLRIEPGLFENITLYPTVVPSFATKEQLNAYPIDRNYRPNYSSAKLFTTPETEVDYNNRIYDVLRKISLSTELMDSNELNYLVVAHASTVDMAVGLLRTERRNSTHEDLYQIGNRVPYCSTVVLERVDGQRGWKPNPFAIPPVSYRNFTNAFLASFVNRP